MERQYVESSMITSIGYDEDNSILEIEFNSGVVWQYPDFPEYMWNEFQSSESKGKYFQRIFSEANWSQKLNLHRLKDTSEVFRNRFLKHKNSGCRLYLKQTVLIDI